MTESFPDYSILIENEASLLNPDFDMNTFLNEHKLESAVYIGHLRCNLIINSSIYDIVIFWAPEEYYLEHSKVTIKENEILIDESFSILEDIVIGQDLYLNFSYDSNNITLATQVGNSVYYEDVLTSRVVSRSWSKSEEEKYLFFLSETFFELFGDFFDNLTINYLLLFEFSETIIKSYLPHKLNDFLIERRVELDSYFDYIYNSTDIYESRLRGSSLESQLSSFNENFKEYTWSRVAVFYIICIGISAVVITNTSQGFFKSQKERIEFYYLRGSKKSDFLRNFLKLETRLLIFVSLSGFLISTILMGILQPRLLTFAYNNALNLIISCITSIIYCSIQFLVSADCLSTIYRRNVKEKKFILNKIITSFKNGLQWIFLCIALAVSLYLYLFTSIEKVERSLVFFYIYTLLIVVVLLLIISKRIIVWLGDKFISLLKSFSSISKYTLKVSKKVIRVNSLVIQMLILFGFMCSFFVVSTDTINHYNYINQQNNAIGEIVLNYQEAKEDLVKLHLANFTEQYLEIEYAVSPLHFMIDANTSIASGLKVFLLNSSTIAHLFNLEIVKNKYSGSNEPAELVMDFSTNWNMSIINWVYADKASIQLGETTELSLPIVDNSSYYPEDWYNITVLDIVEFVPLFSGISQEKPYALLNKEITQNRTEIDIYSIYQILWLNENSSVEILEQYILNINREFNLGIEIFILDENLLFTDEYWLPNVLQTLFISFFIDLIICMVFFFYIFYSDVIRFQIYNFRTFFARGLSLKKGIFHSVLPVLLFTLGYIVLGFVLGVSLLAIVLSTIQPEFYLRIPISIYPYSSALFGGQIALLCCVLFLVGLVSYRKLQKQIPSMDRIAFTVFKDEGGIL